MERCTHTTRPVPTDTEKPTEEEDVEEVEEVREEKLRQTGWQFYATPPMLGNHPASVT